MKKIFALILCLIFALSVMVACADKTEESADTTGAAQTTAADAGETTTEDAGEETTTEDAGEETTTEAEETTTESKSLETRDHTFEY